MEICFPINTLLLLSHTLANLEGWWVEGWGLGWVGGGGGGVPPPALSLCFGVRQQSPVLCGERSRLCKRLVWACAAQSATFMLLFCVSPQKQVLFLNVWFHWILVNFKYGQLSRKVHSSVINSPSNWLICHFEAVFVCLLTKWLP